MSDGSNAMNLKVGEHKKVESDKLQCDMCHTDTDILYDTPLPNGNIKRFCESCWLEYYKSVRPK